MSCPNMTHLKIAKCILDIESELIQFTPVQHVRPLLDKLVGLQKLDMLGQISWSDMSSLRRTKHLTSLETSKIHIFCKLLKFIYFAFEL
jgi:hypothetical protein